MRPGALLLLGAIAGGFVLELQRHALADPAALYALGALPDARGLERQWWRLLSYAFLHWNTGHLLANAGLLAWLAPVVERRLGAWRLWAVFLVAAVIGGLAIVCKHAWWPAPGVTVGASGGAFAVLALAAGLLWRDPRAPRNARIAVLLVLAIGLAVSFLPGVSLLGHLVGLGVGLAAFAIFAAQSPTTISPLSTLRREPGALASAGQERMPSK